MNTRKQLTEQDLANIMSYAGIVISRESMTNLATRQKVYAQLLSQIDQFNFGLTGPINISASITPTNQNTDDSE
ncbi:MAG: hypothetical protein ACJ0OL_02885 [Dehalococcoidia bacterium]